MKSNEYQFLMEFTQGTHPCYSHLERRYGEEMIEYALEKNYIIKFSKTTDGEDKFAITEDGKKRRDN